MPDQVRHDGEGESVGDDKNAVLFDRLGLRTMRAKSQLAEAAE